MSNEIKALNEVIWSFSKNLKGVSTTRHRFNIHVVNSKADERKSLDGSIKSIWKYFDQSKVLNKSIKETKLSILDLIRDTFYDVSADLKWDKTKILEAYDKCLRENIEFGFTSKIKLNKSKTNKGRIRVEIQSDKASIFGIIEQKNNSEPVEILIMETFPYQVSWFKTFENFKWIDEDRFGFEFDDELTLTISVRDTKAVWAHSDSDEDLGFIKSITYNQFVTDKERIEWINK